MLRLWDRVEVLAVPDGNGMRNVDNTYGVVYFVGNPFVGVGLDDPLEDAHDGVMLGKRYFHTAPGHGIFVDAEFLHKVPNLSPRTFIGAHKKCMRGVEPHNRPDYQHLLHFERWELEGPSLTFGKFLNTLRDFGRTMRKEEKEEQDEEEEKKRSSKVPK